MSTIPTTTPPTAARRNSPTPPAQVAPSPTAAASATLYAVIAVASLSRDSPCRMVVILDGRPTRRAMAAAATASVGATTAPRTSAAGSGSPGTTR